MKKLTLVLSLLPESALAQCALCREAVTAAAPHIREAMNHAIISLAFAPYLIAFGAAWALSPPFRTFVRGQFKRMTFGRLGSRS
jgi:hypothetical protein